LFKNRVWGLEFDNRSENEASPSIGPALFFSAGINGYADGLFGTFTPVAAELTAENHESPFSVDGNAMTSKSGSRH
jgi:hypothetical protein